MIKYIIVVFVITFSISSFAQSSLLDYGRAEVNGKSILQVSQWPPNLLLEQLPNGLDGLFADETCSYCPTGQQTVADNFFHDAYVNSIDEIVIWGGYYPEDIPNITDDFTIILHADSGGQPGEVLASVSGLQAWSREQTGVILFDTHEYMFKIRTPPLWLPLSPGTFWIELFNNSTESSNFYWETGNLDVANGVAGSAWYTTTPGTDWNLNYISEMSIRVRDNWIPVELISFQATANGSDINLSWITATETNNQGFEVQSSAGSEFETIAFIEGHGTTTETQVYNYSDKNVYAGSYSYRLKQVDFDGTFEYSKVVEVDVLAPAKFALDQNYPNPFNPSTKIIYSIAVDSKVKLTVYNLLGETIATLVNATVAAGNQEVTYNGSNLNSGIYFYKLEAVGVDGSNFSQVRKMMLTK